MQWSACIRFAFSALFLIALAVVANQPAKAQRFQVIQTFTGGRDGANPYAGLTIQGTNLYGTAAGGGAHSLGTVFRLQNRGSGWTFGPFYSFTGTGGDGARPYAGVVFGPSGTLYGTTLQGGGPGGWGTVFELRPRPSIPPSPLTPWNETVLYSFTGGGGGDGASPDGDLVFDRAGNLYGTTSSGGYSDDGVVYEMTPSGAESVLYQFPSEDGAALPYGGVILDSSGDLYGTTFVGGSGGLGTAYELTPTGGAWTITTLASFQNDGNGDKPHAGLIFDHQALNLYGATTEVEGRGGTIFQLTPSDGGWTLNTLYQFAGPANELCGPHASLFMDAAGDMYGTTVCDGAFGYGNVFKLTPSNGGWIHTDLYDVTGGSDGAYPYSNVVVDINGNLYGTASEGGNFSGVCDNGGCGVVWEITP